MEETTKPAEISYMPTPTQDIQIATAKAYPRKIEELKQKAIATVTSDKEFAEKCFYAIPRAGKIIDGPSVHLARVLAQIYGNIRAEVRVIDVGAKDVTAEASVIDLETNFAYRDVVKRSIMDKKGRRYNDDMIVVTGNAAKAIAFRNAVFTVIPKGVVDSVANAAKNTMLGNLTDEQAFLKKRTQVIDGFLKSFGVTSDEIFTLLKIDSIEKITRDHLVTLVGIAQSIKDGAVTVETAFNRSRKEEVKKNAEASEEQRIHDFIVGAKSKSALEEASEYIKNLPVNHDLRKLYLTRLNELTK